MTNETLSTGRFLSRLRPLFLLGVVGVFAYTGVVKILAIEEFVPSIRGFRIPLGDTLETTVAAILPVVEIAGAIGILSRKFRRGALVVLGILCVVFFVALMQAVLRGFIVDCGCFGKSDAAPTALGMFWAILRDVLLFGAISYLYKTERAPEETGD